jgi:SAM-dependent methyltransferase
MRRDNNSLNERTVRDFGRQWTRYQDNSGFYGSVELFEDAFSPLLKSASIAGARVADVGAGTGRFVRVFVALGARHVFALEPSAAIDVLRRNTADIADRVSYLHVRGDELPVTADLDLAFSYGVLHHIPDPVPVLRAMKASLKPGGRCLVWLYGREGNGFYLALSTALRAVTCHLPHAFLGVLVWLLYGPVTLYTIACRYMSLPLSAYLCRVFANLPPDKRRLVIYDQLNPAYAKYYSQQEARALLEGVGFVDVRLYHRHGYSWSVVGTKE